MAWSDLPRGTSTLVDTVVVKLERAKSNVFSLGVGWCICWSRWWVAHNTPKASPATVLFLLQSHSEQLPRENKKTEKARLKTQ